MRNNSLYNNGLYSHGLHSHVPNESYINNVESELTKTPLDGCPWLNDSLILNGIIGLDKEIRLFYDYMKPTKEEKAMRDRIVSDITIAVKNKWPGIRVEVFGSVSIDLALPLSDIDVVFFGNWTRPPYNEIKDFLFASNLAKSVKIIDRAAVPIVRVTDKRTNIKVDICFNRENGIKNARQIKAYMNQYQDLKYLAFVLKYYLSFINLNEVYTGGLSSYGLVLLLVNFLQNYQPLVYKSNSNNLGVLLIEFFNLFGSVFNYHECGICLHTGYFKKPYSSFPRLCIVDPIDPRHDITKGSFRIVNVFENFANAFYYLHTAVGPANDGQSRSFLQGLFYIDGELISFREWVKICYL